MSENKNCYDKIDFELIIETEILTDKPFETIKQEINTVLILELPKYLKNEYDVEAYVNIKGYRNGSLIVIGSMLIKGLEVLSRIKDLYEIINLIKDFLENRLGKPSTTFKIVSVYPIVSIVQPKKVITNDWNFSLQIITIILLVFLIGLYLGKIF